MPQHPQEGKGQVEQAAGELLDDDGLRQKGQADQQAGGMKRASEQWVVREIRERAARPPKK
jgi:uncharacterized protein YjbJ (UPF0337 family)